MILASHLHMPSYCLKTFTECPENACEKRMEDVSHLFFASIFHVSPPINDNEISPLGRQGYT